MSPGLDLLHVRDVHNILTTLIREKRESAHFHQACRM